MRSTALSVPVIEWRWVDRIIMKSVFSVYDEELQLFVVGSLELLSGHCSIFMKLLGISVIFILFREYFFVSCISQLTTSI